MKTYLHDFLSLLFPALCCVCSEPLAGNETLLCTGCRLALPLTGTWLEADNMVSRKLQGRVPIASAQGLLTFTKGGMVQHLLHLLKYRGREEVGQWLGRLAGQLLLEAPLATQVQGLVPVPVDEARRRQRGYNQCEAVARGLAEVLPAPALPDALRKERPTDSQTHKSRLQRLQNVQEVYVVNRRELIAGQTLLLVDDVITTGATLEACTQALLAAGSGPVHILTLATAE